MSNPVILLNGAAGAIGEATVKRFSAEGWQIAVVSLSHPERLEALASDTVTPIDMDIRDAESVRAGIASVENSLGPIEAIVNNEGFVLAGSVEQLSIDDLHRQFDLLVYSLVRVIQAALPLMRERGHGTIVNVSSVGGLFAFPSLGGYHSARFAVEGLSEALRLEVMPFGIRVKIIETAVAQSDFGFRIIRDNTHPANAIYGDAMRRYWLEIGAKLNRPSTPEEIADAIFHAATDPSETLRYYVGEDIKKVLAEYRKRSYEDFADWMFRKNSDQEDL
ncbi:MAG: SDR family NAD(P)-dependent oxidoreductase [Chlorobi bacterium]|nr:SDR family NAD(P)-dependent oxidoreductase [Chlorobiota bacterium]